VEGRGRREAGDCAVLGLTRITVAVRGRDRAPYEADLGADQGLLRHDVQGCERIP